MGFIMFMGINNGFKRLIWVLPFLLFISPFSYAAPSCIAFALISKNDKDGNGPEGEGYIKTSCKLPTDGSNTYICGNPSKETNNTLVKSDSTGFTIYNRWYEKGFFDNGYWFWDQQFNYASSLSSNQNATGNRALMSALKNGNCDVAQALAEAMGNPQFYKDPETGESGIGIKNGSDRCVIKEDGSSLCKFNKEEYDENGNPKLKICGEVNCDSGTLEEYAQGGNSKNKGETGGVQDNPDEKGSGGINEHRGGSSNTGGTNAGSGSGAGSTGSGGATAGGGSGGKGGGGSGKGNGKGNGGQGLGTGEKGDGKDDKDTEGVDFFEAPSMSESFGKLGKVLKDKYLKSFSIDGGNCPTPNITIMKRSFTITQHCEILKAIESYFASLMMFLYTFTAIRIVLSA